MAKNSSASERISNLEDHLEQENPTLARVVKSFRKLDSVAHRLGILDANDSFTNQVAWWPVISVLGIYSAGKSTFLNQYVGGNPQRTGNQAVDDKFTVMCYGDDDNGAVLPGQALDSDPRFPFFQISNDIEKVAEGEGRRIDSYLQLKTCKSERLRGKIFIDSPGFDADEQRTSTLLITGHIIDLSDLVLVFFDARHPEPGAMGDTLEHLVTNTVSRPDANKFLYVLNQIDTTAREDNPEEVVAAWQRALAKHGLTAGRFYRIYSRDAATAIEDDQVRERMERKRDEDLDDIEARIRQVEMARSYRVVGELEKTAKYLSEVIVPHLKTARGVWQRRTLWLCVSVFGVLLVAFLMWSIGNGHWENFRFTPIAARSDVVQVIIAVLGLVAATWLYVTLRRLAGRSVVRTLKKEMEPGPERADVLSGFSDNLHARWRSVASSQPKGWTRRTRNRLDDVLADANRFVQALNDRYARPSGETSGTDDANGRRIA